MSKKDDFKEFVNNHPELIKSVTDNKMTWQKYYELYDLFGADESKWEPYLNETRAANKVSLAGLTNMIKNVNMNSVQKHVNTAQKAINLFQEMTTKTKGVPPVTKGPNSLRPIGKFFED